MDINELRNVIIKYKPISFQDETIGKKVVIEEDSGVMKVFENYKYLKFINEYKDMKDFVKTEFEDGAAQFANEFSYEVGLRNKLKELFPHITFVYVSKSLL